eukprot:scaffold29.g5952.t1
MSEGACGDAGRAPRYKSKFPGNVAPKDVPCSLLGVKKVRAAATMGPGAGDIVVDPKQFLHKHEKEPVLPPPAKPAPKPRLKSPLPKRDERPAMGLSSGKDFVAGNVAEAAAAPPRYQEREEVNYTLKPWFGEVPPYLQRRRRELEEQRRAAQAPPEQARGCRPGGVTCVLPEGARGDGGQLFKEKLDVAGSRAAHTLSGAELEELVTHLKLKWQTLNEAYQRLPMVLDTPSKKRRKQEMEGQLAEIERDVKLLSKAAVVHVF